MLYKNIFEENFNFIPIFAQLLSFKSLWKYQKYQQSKLTHL